MTYLNLPHFLTVLVALLGSSSLWAANFGKDDRIMLTPRSPYYNLSRSTAVAVLNTLVEETSPKKYKMLVESSDSFLCSDEKFSHKPSLPYACSGFLVAPDLLVTAGHCMVNHGETRNETGMYCEAYGSWIFDYSLDTLGRPRTENIPQENHYKCKQIVYAVSDKTNDYALVQLDRPVTGRLPLPLSEAPVGAQERLKMIGHPLGLPSVLSQNARIFENDPNKSYYVTNLDAFEGNSGSAVFNSKNQIVGVLISGTPSENLVDQKQKTQSCSRHNFCDENGLNCLSPDEPTPENPQGRAGTEVQKIQPLIKLIKEFQSSRNK